MNHQTLEGSFLAIPTPIFATKVSFCSVFRVELLQDLQSFAPQILMKISGISQNILENNAEIF